jgi:Zn-dependent protease/predicted transcriptional regulator
MRIGKIFGIDITINVSWLFVFALMAWSLGSSVGPLRAVGLSMSARITLGIVMALLFFASVLAHELAHSLVARARGVPIAGITLFIFGGVSSFEGEPSTAPAEAWISGVGPLTSLVLGGVFYALALAFGLSRVAYSGVPVASDGAVHDPQLALAVAFGYLAAANVALAIFNILPAFPLDGGRVFHAVAWRVTGDRLRATRIAVVVGRVIASIFIIYGIIVTLVFGLGGGLWLTFIGWFLIQAGNAEQLQAEVTTALRGHPVSDLAAEPVMRLPADETADAALRTMLGAQAHALPVFVGDRFIGIVAMSDFAKVGPDGLPATYVTAIMTRAEDLTSVSPTTEATEALKALARSGHQQLPVIGPGGDLLGFVTRDAIVRWVAAAGAR